MNTSSRLLPLIATLVTLACASASALAVDGDDDIDRRLPRPSGIIGNDNRSGATGHAVFATPTGARKLLPLDWSTNAYHPLDGFTFYVDPQGRYWVASQGGWWTPLQRVDRENFTASREPFCAAPAP